MNMNRFIFSAEVITILLTFWLITTTDLEMFYESFRIIEHSQFTFII